MTERWNNFWFEPAGPENLGFCRLLFFAALLMLYGSREYAPLGELSGAFWQPLPLFRRLSLPLFSAEVLAGMAILWKIALLLSCVGLLTRASIGIAFVLGVYLIGLRYNFGTLSHMDAVIVFIVGILAFSKSGDAWSVDKLLRGRRRRRIAEVSPFNGEYTWPIRMAWVLMAIVFFAAGLAKLQTSGFEWVSSGTLAKFLVRAADPLSTTSAVALAPALGLSLVQVPWLIYLMAAGTLMIELGYPLALVSSRLRVLITVSACMMLIGVRVVMGPPFWPLIACHLFWVPWDRVNRRLFSFITRVQEPPSTRPASQDQAILADRF